MGHACCNATSKEDKKCTVCDPGEVDEQGGKRKSEKHMGSQMHTSRGQQVRWEAS